MENKPDRLTFGETMSALHCIGGMAEQRRLEGKSLSKSDRALILEIRRLADSYFSVNMQAEFERRGAEIVRDALFRSGLFAKLFRRPAILDITGIY